MRKRKWPLGEVEGTQLELVAHDRQTGYGIFLCECGNAKRLQYRYVFSGKTPNCSDGAKHSNPRIRLSYDGWHKMLRRWRGPASGISCIFCGKADRWNSWSYLHDWTGERVDIVGKDARRPYAPDARAYVSMCRSCHSRYDRAHTRGMPQVLRRTYAYVGGAGKH